MNDQDRQSPIAVETNSTGDLAKLLAQNASQVQGFASMVMAQIVSDIEQNWPGAFEGKPNAYVNAHAWPECPLEIQVTAHCFAEIDGKEVRLEIMVL